MTDLSLQQVYVEGEDFALALIKALGLPGHVQKLELIFEGGQLPLIRCEFLPDARALQPVLSSFELQARAVAGA